ncbi:PilZ domain-containing protein [Sphingomonas piscis]|uniref:PilZ domain-containing protein n=1 Tax=Sphingomonas piscis TaxID=2714943 RepID=A0A6G7YQ39_9SPHN|nr:PilZ domain-containing protein [Sphingomonas piscis]QIK78851.1 PilZ domain-containing protein [Sphingomonas piscis]
MTTVRAHLETLATAINRRGSLRKQLRLLTDGATEDGVEEVLILNISRTGMLIEVEGELTAGDTIEVAIPEADGARAIVQWTDGKLFGCKFDKPIPLSAVSAALLRAEPSSQVEAALSWDYEKAPTGSTLRWAMGISLAGWLTLGGLVMLLAG